MIRVHIMVFLPYRGMCTGDGDVVNESHAAISARGYRYVFCRTECIAEQNVSLLYFNMGRKHNTTI